MTEPMKTAESQIREKSAPSMGVADVVNFTATAHDVILERSNNEKIAVEYVRDWEIPILKAVHGQDRVVIRDSYKIDLSGESANPAREYQRLKAKYNRRGDNIDVVDRVLGADPKQLAKEMGVNYDRSMEEGGVMAQAENTDNRPNKKKK